MSGGGGGDTEVEETEAQKAQQEVAIERFNDYQRRFAPLEDQLIDEVRAQNSPGHRAQASGRANAASQQQFGQATEQVRDQAFAQGQTPSSGAYQARMADLGAQSALGTGLNQAQAGLAQDSQRMAGLQGITRLGRGQSASALSQYGNVASSSQQQAIDDARNALNEHLAQQQLIGTGLGAATAIGQGYASQAASSSPGGGLTDSNPGQGVNFKLSQQPSYTSMQANDPSQFSLDPSMAGGY